MIILGLLIIYGHPARFRDFLEKIITTRIRTILFFLLVTQIIVVFLFLVTEYRSWFNRMYDEFTPGSKEQRIYLCEREYLHAIYISKYFHQGDHVLLAGEQVDPFFLNYYLYPVYLYHYDNRPIAPYEIYSTYVRRWLLKKNIKFILVYTPYSGIPWNIFTTGNRVK